MQWVCNFPGRRPEVQIDERKIRRLTHSAEGLSLR
jgi:hypothetical protein